VQLSACSVLFLSALQSYANPSFLREHKYSDIDVPSSDSHSASILINLHCFSTLQTFGADS
jgi:hypothetical protein